MGVFLRSYVGSENSYDQFVFKSVLILDEDRDNKCISLYIFYKYYIFEL